MAYSKEAVFSEAKALGEKNDCSVKALALSTKLSYSNAHELLRVSGRKAGKGAALLEIENAYSLAGYDLVSITSKVKARGAKTNISFKRIDIPKSYKCIIVYSRHVAASRGNEILDWTEGRKHRIVHVFRVVKR